MLKNTTSLKASELKKLYQEHNPEGHYFDYENMKFLGDTIPNFQIKDGGDTWDLFRKKDTIPKPPNNNIIQKAGYLTSFSKTDFKELGDIKNHKYHTSDLSERVEKIISKTKSDPIKVNNPDRIKYDLVIYYDSNNNIRLLNENNQVIQQYLGWKEKDVHNLIVEKYPGRKIAIQPRNEIIQDYAKPTGYDFGESDKTENFFMKKVRQHISTSLEDKSSVLLLPREGVDYSVNATGGQVYQSIKQLYLQQIRHDRNLESCYFVPAYKTDNLKDDSKGIVIGNYDPHNKYMKYDYLYNFNDIFNVKSEKPKPLISPSNTITPSIKSIIKIPETNERLNALFKYTLTDYFNSIYSGAPYSPSTYFINDSHIIADKLKSKDIKLYSAAFNAQVFINNHIRSSNNQNRNSLGNTSTKKL